MALAGVRRAALEKICLEGSCATAGRGCVSGLAEEVRYGRLGPIPTYLPPPRAVMYGPAREGAPAMIGRAVASIRSCGIACW